MWHHSSFPRCRRRSFNDVIYWLNDDISADCRSKAAVTSSIRPWAAEATTILPVGIKIILSIRYRGRTIHAIMNNQLLLLLAIVTMTTMMMMNRYVDDVASLITSSVNRNAWGDIKMVNQSLIGRSVLFWPGPSIPASVDPMQRSICLARCSR